MSRLNAIGEPAKKIFNFHIENKYAIKPKIFQKTGAFVVALKTLLGAAGTYVESLI
jgi:hypothetical protein